MSKAYGLPGLRIGWIACRDRAVLDRLERAKHYTTICNSAPSEVLALIALRARDHLLDRNRGIVAANLPVFTDFFARYPELFEFTPPDGGCVCFPRYLGADGVETMCARARRTGRRTAAAVEHLQLRTDRDADRPLPRRRRPLGPSEALDRWADWLEKRR